MEIRGPEWQIRSAFGPFLNTVTLFRMALFPLLGRPVVAI